MKNARYILTWVLVGILGLAAQLWIAKWATETERDPDLEPTIQFPPEMYPEISGRITDEGLQSHIDALSSIPSRLTGSRGANEAAEYIMSQFRALGVGEPTVHEFPVTVPVSDRAEMTLANGERFPIHPLYPNGIVPAGFPPEGKPTRLVYAGFGRLTDVTGKELEGATVVVETGAREQWLYLIDLGAEAIIFVERERPRRALEDFTQSFAHQSIPRFWMRKEEAAPLLDRLRDGDIEAHLHSDARWEKRTGKNIYVDIPGVSDAPHNEEEIVVLSAYYDSTSYVPSLAPGAQQACGIAALLELATIIRDHPFEKNVRLLATSGHFQALEGIRRYVWDHIGQHDIPMRAVAPMGHAAFFSLDLSTGTDQLGLFYGGHFFQQHANNLKPRLSDLGMRATRYVAGSESENITGIAEILGWNPEVVFVDTINPIAGKDWPNYLPSPMALEHEAALLAGVPALSFVTANDARLFSGTPNDTDVDIHHLVQQTQLLACLLPNAFNVEGRYLRRSLPRSIARIQGRAVVFDPREGYLPDKALEDGIIMVRQQGVREHLTNVRTRPVAKADEDGHFEFVGLGTTAEVPLHTADLAFEPFRVEHGRITWAADFGGMGREFYPITLRPVQKEMELMCVAFECKTLEIYNLIDPRNQNILTNLEVLEAGSNSVPPVYGTSKIEPGWPSYHHPTVTIFAPRDMRLKITAGAGGMNRRMLFLNVPDRLPEDEVLDIGEGFDVNTTPAIHRTYLQGARDMWRLNESRIRFFREHGIENARVNRLHGMAADALEEAEHALDAKDYATFFSEARRALSLESRAYPDVLGMANDTVRGLLFYLALLLPFAFTMERLFLAGRRIETRILGVVMMFLIMFFLLRFSHPGFLIVLSPMVVLLGFVVAVMSITVISIVMGKLETLVSKHKQEQQGEHSSGVQAVSGFALALEMGIANMRRRKARTVLTSITLIALTFSVLSFVSVTDEVRLQQYLYREGATPYDGVLLRQRNWAPFPFETFISMRNELEGTAVVAPRRWYYGALVLNQSSIDIRHMHTIRTLRALIGLTPQEEEFINLRPAMLGNSRWLSPEQPGEDLAEEVLLPLNLAIDFLADIEAEIEIDLDIEDLAELETETDIDLARREMDRIANAIIDREVVLLGRSFTVVGVFDWSLMNDLVDIDGEPLSPYDPVQMEQKFQEEGVPDPEEIQRYIHHSFRDVAILHERILGDLGGDVRSIAIKPHNPEDIEVMVAELVERMDYILFANIGGVPMLMSSRAATSISEYWNLIILTFIAALIVFNTMLGSVYERTKEIGTYTALGIAPSHIGRLFLVEAAVFSIIGVMAGYVVGQSVSRVVSLVDFPLLGALNLNYSSLAGVGACIVVMAVVMLSALYPARKASEIGVPDIERRWKLPPTKEACITLELPFTVSMRESQGLVEYLKEYLDSHVDVSVGAFYVENVEAGPHVAEGKGTGVRGQFWLTPFDLGVSQYTTIILSKLEDMDVCGVTVVIERLSGDAGSWRRANSRFMSDMRSQFLIWRNLSPEARADYVERGREFALTP